MKRSFILASSVATLVVGAGLGIAANAHHGDAPQPASVNAPILLPACESDAPDVSTSPDCVWFDEGHYLVVRDHMARPYFACATGDATDCVVDTEAMDSATRFTVHA